MQARRLDRFACVWITVKRGNNMTDKQVISAISYIYLKSELKKISEANNLTDKQVKHIENSLKAKLGVGKELCWV